MLTNLQIDRLKAESKVTRYSDRDGLTLEVRPSGNKRFIFRFQWGKKPQTIALGRYPSLSLADARKISLSYRTLVDNNIDPRATLEAKSVRKTVRHVAEAWLDKNKHSWRDATIRIHSRGVYRDILPVIGDKLIDDISKADLLRVIHPHEELGHHEIAHRLHDRLKAIFDYALAAGLTENYPFIGLKKALSPKPKVKNHIALNSNEAHELLNAVRASKSSTVTKIYIELLAILFVRPSELRLAQWSEFNLQQAEWLIPTERMKMDSPHWVPLSYQAIRLLKELRAITGFKTYLFCSNQTHIHKPISEACARNLIHKLGYKNRHCLHGFRTIASSLLHSESNFRSDAIEAQLAHKVQGVRGIYLRADFKQERKEMMQWYSNWVSPPTDQMLKIK
jgi:integrase